ncbi:MAG: hypothetical protein ABMA01_15275, partial [Chthoniobacteraceae bacterium]
MLEPDTEKHHLMQSTDKTTIPSHPGCRERRRQNHESRTLRRIRNLVRSGFLGALLMAAALPAGKAEEGAHIKLSTAAPKSGESLSLGDQLENLGRIYHNKDNPILQTFWLLGRYHGQYHWGRGSAANDDGYESRRIRLGMQVHMFNHLTLHAQAISGSDFEPVYNG